MCSVSVNDLIARLPDAGVVGDRCRAMAALDAIMSPEWHSRYFSFDPVWSPSLQTASMRDGSGNEYAIVFAPEGLWAYGFDHESQLSPYRRGPLTLWPGLLDGMPEAFRPLAQEPAFCDPGGPTLRATVCFWREQGAAAWACGSPAVPDRAGEDGGAGWLFEVLVEGAEGYAAFARDYYEAEVDIEAVRHVYALRPLTPQILAGLNPELEVAEVADELRSIGLALDEGY